MIWRNLVSDSAIYGGADFVSKSVTLLTFPLVAAVFSPADFGTLELVLTLTALLGSVANLGLNNAVQRYYWDKDVHANQRPELVSSGYVVLLGALFVVSLIALAAIGANHSGKFLTHEAISIFGLFAAIMLMNMTQLLQFTMDVIRLHFAPWRFLIVSCFSRIGASVAAVIGVVFLGFGLDGFISIQVAMMMVALPLALWFISKDLTKRVSPKWMKTLTSFGYPFIFAGIAFWLFASMDRWMLATMTSVEEVGIYSIASRFAVIVMFFSMAFGQAWSPISIKVRTDNPETYRQFYADVLVVLTALMLVLGSGVALFAGEILSFLPKVYWDAALPLVVLSLGLVLQATQQVTAIGISLEKKTYLFARLAWFSAGVNLILNYTLIPQFGALGAAWATSISYFVLTAGYCYFTQRLHKLPIDWNRISLLGATWIALVIIASNTQIHTVSLGSTAFKVGGLIGLTGFCALIIPWRSLQHVQ